MNEVSEQTKGENQMKKTVSLIFLLVLIGMIIYPYQSHAEERSENDVVVFFKIEKGSDSLLKDSSGNETEVIRKVVPESENISNYIPKIVIKNDEKFIKWNTDIHSKDEIIYTAAFKSDGFSLNSKLLIFSLSFSLLLAGLTIVWID